MKQIFFLLIFIFSIPANALETITGNVTTLEVSYMPSAVTFRLDSGTSTCPPGTWLKWSKTQDSNKAVYAALAAAVVSGNRVTLLINDGDKTCTGQFFYLQN